MAINRIIIISLFEFIYIFRILYMKNVILKIMKYVSNEKYKQVKNKYKINKIK